MMLNRQTRRARKSGGPNEPPVQRIGKDGKPSPPSQDAAEGRPILADYINTEQLAAELNVTPLTIVRWRRRKIGPPITYLGRRILYRRASVERWLAAREQTHEIGDAAITNR
jgi:Helix-turn-helix domain